MTATKTITIAKLARGIGKYLGSRGGTAFKSGNTVRVSYDPSGPTFSLARNEAERYLDYLEGGGTAPHHEALAR